MDGYISNLRQVIRNMPSDIKVIPGHGPLADIAAVARSLQVIEDTRRIVVSGMRLARTAPGLPRTLVTTPIGAKALSA